MIFDHCEWSEYQKNEKFDFLAVEGGELLMQVVRTSGATEQPTNNNFGAFGGSMARGTWAYRLLCGSLWVLKYPYCHQMITQTYGRGDQRVLEKVES